MKIGIIGTGNMGSMLARAFAAAPNIQVQIINRNPYKAEQVQMDVPSISIAPSLQALASSSDMIVISTKSEDGKAVLAEIGPTLTEQQTLATTVSSWPLEWIESQTNASVVKVIPSVTQTVLKGVILLSFGDRDDVQEHIEPVFAKIGTPFIVSDAQIRVCSDLTSCGPAFLSLLCSRWAEAAAETGQLSFGEAEYLISKMLVGLAGLLQEGFTLSEVLNRVAVKGGVTETGIAALNKPAHDLFERLHQATARHKSPAKIAKFTSA